MNLHEVKCLLRAEKRRNYSLANISPDHDIAQSCLDVAHALGIAVRIIDREERRHEKKKKA